MTVRLVRRNIPSAQVRRAKAPRLPTMAESLLVFETRKLVASYIAKILPIAFGAVADFARAETERADARDDGLDKAREAAGLAKQNATKARKVSSYMRAVAQRALRTGLPAFEARSKLAADRVRATSKAELGRLKLVVKKEPELRPLIDGWRKDNVARITGLADEHVQRIEAILANGFTSYPGTIVREIQALGIMSDRRAELIARDQILTLNSQINRRRQVAAGVESYVWTTQNDARVREEHADLDGKTFSWDDGGDPEEGHPGEAINCRCISFPIAVEKTAGEDVDTDVAEAAE